MDHTLLQRPGSSAVKTCCCVRDVLQGNEVIIVIIQRNLDTVRNIDRFCQLEGSQFEIEHTLCIQLRLIFSFLFSLQPIALSRSAAYQNATSIAADVLATPARTWKSAISPPSICWVKHAFKISYFYSS